MSQQQQSNPFHKAQKAQARLRMALYGASGSGKTYSALAIGQSLGKVALIDTERGSASKYAGLFVFDVLELTDPHPKHYIAAIQAAAGYGYEVLIIDSLSHAWTKVLELVDNINRNSKSNNSYVAWRDVTPIQNQFIDAILTAPMHIIATMRSKVEYVMERDDRTGKTSPRKVGLAPIQRDGVEYEFDVVAEMNAENDFVVVKTRCPELNNARVNKPGADIGGVLKAWLTDGIEAPPPLTLVPPTEPELAPNTVRGAGINPTPPTGSPASTAPTSANGASADVSDDPDPLLDYGQEQSAVITAIDPREQPEPDEPLQFASESMTITEEGAGLRAYVFHTTDKKNLKTSNAALFDGLEFDPRAWKKGKYPIDRVFVFANLLPTGWQVEGIKSAALTA